MAWLQEDSSCENWAIKYNTTTSEVILIDLVNEVEWQSPIGEEGTTDIAANIVPGFAAGFWVIKVCKLIEKALQGE